MTTSVAAERHEGRRGPVRQDQRVAARRHTRRVKRLRVLLPLLGLGAGVFLLLAAVVPSLLPIAGIKGLQLTAEGLVMNGPHLSGHLGEGRRYHVTADRAIQSLLNPRRLTLEGLTAELDMGEERWVRILGRNAVYDTGEEVLRLREGVELTSSEGHAVSLQTATVFLREGRVVSHDPIAITSPKGEINAGRLDVADDGDVIRLRGGVSIRIHPAGT